ncbi:MAG: hypothetical protein JWO67_990 [Streptosporangiaceae bacterium]|nr:hypothetical protein [Streptosporangiaceae bacterium]
MSPAEQTASNADLAARTWVLAEQRVSDPPARKAALSVGVCLRTTNTLTAARRALTELRLDEAVRAAALELLDELTTEEP